MARSSLLSGPEAGQTVEEIAVQKRRLRKAIGHLRREQPPDADAARAAAALVASLPEFVRAGTIALYAALDDEISARPVFDRARAAGKRCLLPRMTGELPRMTGELPRMTDELPRTMDRSRLEFCEVLHWEDLHRGRYGVPEPPEGAKRVSLARAAVVVVPGVAFDRRGGRLGRGQGFYDRALRAARGEPRGEGAGPFVVGLAASRQLLEEVPVESHDESMDAVVTEREIARVEPGPTAAPREPKSR